jgi:hypothetical protein
VFSSIPNHEGGTMISPIATKQEQTRLQPAAPATGAPLPHIGKRGQMTHKSVRAQTVEAWARVIHDLMYLAPPEKRREILERVLEIGESDNPALVCAAEFRPDIAPPRFFSRVVRNAFHGAGAASGDSRDRVLGGGTQWPQPVACILSDMPSHGVGLRGGICRAATCHSQPFGMMAGPKPR